MENETNTTIPEDTQTNTVQIVKLDESQLTQLKNKYHEEHDFAYIMIFIGIGLFLGYIAIKGVLTPWK